MGKYVLDHHLEGEAARLALMSRLLDPMHRRHLESLGIGEGTRALEVGCGNGSISAWLAERVGPGGHVVAVDLDLSLVDVEAPELELRVGDIVAAPVDPGTFDSSPPGRPASRHRRRCGDPEPRRRLGARGRDPPDRARLPPGERRRAARRASVLGRMARVVARPGHRLPHRPNPGPAARGGRARAGRRDRRDGRVSRGLAVGGLLDADDHRAPGPTRRVWAGRRPARSTPSSPIAPIRSWWTETIAFTAVHARAPRPLFRSDRSRLQHLEVVGDREFAKSSLGVVGGRAHVQGRLQSMMNATDIPDSRTQIGRDPRNLCCLRHRGSNANIRLRRAVSGRIAAAAKRRPPLLPDVFAPSESTTTSRCAELASRAVSMSPSPYHAQRGCAGPKGRQPGRRIPF